MKIYFSLYCLLGLFLCQSCSDAPPETPVGVADTLVPAPYLYKPPVTAQAGLPTAKLKKEDLAEAFVSRLSTQRPAGIVVMQQEKLVLEEYFGIDSTAYICTGPLFPAYTGALLGSMYKNKQAIPNQPIPLQQVYTDSENNNITQPSWPWQKTAITGAQTALLEQLIQQHMQVSQGLAAEELLFEPLQIDEYQWQQESLCLHPHALLQLASLWVRRGRWNNEQLLPDQLIQRVLAPAYGEPAALGSRAFGWQYYRLVARGRKHPVIYYSGQEFALFLLPEIEAVVLLQGQKTPMHDVWNWMQQYLIPSLTP